MVLQSSRTMQHINTACVPVNWLAAKGWKVMRWSPNSPDLNPIEHVWVRMKDFHRHYLKLTLMTGPAAIRAKLIEVLPEM